MAVVPDISAPSVAPSSALFEDVRALMREALEDEVFPGAVLLVGRDGRVLIHEAFGKRSVKSDDDQATPAAMSPHTVFDVAALTMPVVTTSCMMRLLEAGKISLQDRVARYVQSFGVWGKNDITIEHLLAHTSGLPAWLPLFEELVELNSRNRLGLLTSRAAKEHVYKSLNSVELKHKPGTTRVFSDVGFILLGQLIELLTGLPLDKAAFKLLFQPLGLSSSSFVDLSLIRRRGIHPVPELIAPTEDCAWRKRVLCGEVHDDNAWAMGGVAGHCGLFSAAPDLHRVSTVLLDAYHGRSSFVRRETLRQFWQGVRLSETEVAVLGWDSPSKDNGLAESKLSPNARGGCGFTGCSLWIEPDLGLDIILLSNRVHPSRNNKKLQAFRPRLHDAVLAVVGS